MRAPEKVPHLVLREGENEEIYPLHKDVITIGRAPDNDIELSDLSSSRKHCRIVKRNGRWELIDLDSRNGTLVNGVLVLRKELVPGDVIEIGRTRLFFQVEGFGQDLPTMRLDTAFFLDPLADLSPEDQAALLRRERELFLRILEVIRVLNTTRVVREVLRKILQLILDVTQTEHGVALLRDPRKDSNFTLRAFRRIDSTAAAKEAELVARVLGPLAGEGGGPIVCTDMRSGEGARTYRALAAIGVRSFLCLPLKDEDELLGLLYVDSHREAGALDEHQLHLVDILAAHGAIALRNARLCEESRHLQRELRETQEKLQELRAKLRRQAVREAASLRDAVQAARQVERPALKYNYDEIITSSPKMFRVLEVVDKVVDSTVPVLIEGESGTGKELIARAIHYNGKRAGGRFVSENCAAIPANLLESEFFGHERGAFTGASHAKPGLFELADGGTLFLDEIGDMPLALQSKFLRVLQNGEIRRVGGNKVIKVDVRIISATNQNLRELIRQGRFREDLYYRLNVVTIRLPPLRERKEDIPLLIEYFLKRIAERTGSEPKTLTPEALRLLEEYDWPGNVRELENEIERLAALSRGPIEAALVSDQVKDAVGTLRRYGGRSLREIVRKAVAQVEEEVIRAALREHGWKKTKTASVLGISRPTLDNKIEKYRIRRGRPS